VILVDTSVWIDYFRGTASLETALLDRLLGSELLLMGDLILVEILQGFDDDRQFSRARFALEGLELIHIGGGSIALQAANHFRALRRQGITVRKTIDTLIATRCIVDGHQLLYADRDFDPFVEHLGLQPCLAK